MKCDYCGERIISTMWHWGFGCEAMWCLPAHPVDSVSWKLLKNYSSPIDTASWKERDRRIQEQMR